MAEVRNTIELNIYNDELEVVKKYETYGIRWKTFKKIMSMQDELEELSKASDDEAIEKMNDIVRLVFPSITDEDLGEAYVDDIYNCVQQAVNVAQHMAKNS